MIDQISAKHMSEEEMASLRERAVAQIGAEGMTKVDAARQAGIAYQTFGLWLNDKYSGDNVVVAEKVVKWLASRSVQRQTRATLPDAPGFHMTQTASDIMDVLEHAQHMPDLVVIGGDAGIGKTTTIDAYRDRTPNVWKITGEPCFTTPKTMLDDIAETLGINEKYSAQKISRAIIQRLRGTNGLLVIDEAQHLSTATLDQVRTIHDLAGIGIALVGNHSVYSRLEGAGRTPAFAQLYSRVGRRLTRNKLQKRDIDTMCDAWRVEDRGVRALLHVIARKPGALRGFTKTLRLALMMARAEGKPLNEEHVHMAYGQIAPGEIGEAG